MCGSRGGTGVWTLLENRKALGFLSNTGLDPLEKAQSYQVSIQCWATIGLTAKRNLNGVLLAGRWPTYILSLHQLTKKRFQSLDEPL